MKNSEQPINPLPSDVDSSKVECIGLTKREYFAAMAMQASDLEVYAEKYGSKWAKEVAIDSVQMADALLAELEKPTNESNIQQ